jgi:hypothetical protein
MRFRGRRSLTLPPSFDRETQMQDATVFAWSPQSPPRAESRASLRELNRRFLDLAAVRPLDVRSGLIATLSQDQRAAAADCPYALFDLRFHDEGHWRERMRTAPPWQVADSPPADGAIVEFVHLALFYAWHVASTAPLAALMLLGMRESTALAYAGLTVDCLPGLALAHAPHLAPRWQHCDAYWNGLLRAACLPAAADLRRVQLCGLRLAAAARLL